MAASINKLIPLNGMNLDVAPQYLKETQARYLKNFYYQLSDLGEAGTDMGANTGVLKPLPSNEIYCPVDLPKGDNYTVGTLPSKETKELYVWVWNSLNNHSIFRVNGLAATSDIIKVDPCFNFQLDPKYFIGEGQCHLEIIYVTDPNTGLQVTKKDLYWVDGFNYHGYIRVDDSIATNGFDPNTFNYFQGDYDRCPLVRMGVPTPDDCIEIDDVPFNPITDTGKNNNEKFTSWQFRILVTNVFGKPSEHGMISDLYYISNNSCLSSSDSLSRCLNLIFSCGNPFWDKIQIEYRNCNDRQWYLDTVLDLYLGSSLGEWWLRPRNPNVIFNQQTNKITYTFCKDKLCDPIDPNETDRTAPELPRFSQSLTKIGTSIAVSDNKDGFPPMELTELDKVSVVVTPPSNSTIGQTANAEIYIRIYNPQRGNFQQVYKLGSDYVFGGIVPSSANKHIDNIKTAYQQYFSVSGQQGPIGYFAGTHNYAVGVQYYLDANNNFVKDTDFVVNASRKYFLKFEYTGIPKGIYPFRLASHLADPNVIDIRNTSTYVGGVYSFSNLTVGAQKNAVKELQVNVCNGDYSTLTSGEMLMMYDLTKPEGGSGSRSKSNSIVADGYVYKSQDITTLDYQTPVELLNLSVTNTGFSTPTSVITDHNGFYFASSETNAAFGGGYNRYTISFIGYCSCVLKSLVALQSGNSPMLFSKNVVLGSPSQNQVSTYCQDYELNSCNEILITGTLQLCGTETGIPNVNVVISDGGTAITDSNGNFTIIAHDDAYNKYNHRTVYVMGSGCNLTDCDGNCIAVQNVTIAPCTSCVDRSINLGTINALFISSRGQLSGGRYGVSINEYDWIGRHGFSQTTDKLYYNIPTLNSSKSFGFSSIDLIIPPSVTFDSWVDYITLGVTVELNYGGNYIEWIADKVTFVDNSGIENNTAPTQIRIDYASLNQFNIQNAANTTTGWQIIPESTMITTPTSDGGTITTTPPTSPRNSDIVQFIRNGDGKFFANPISAIVKYDQTGQYFLINYTDSLKDLTQNALIRLANPTECANKDSFFELCGKYKVINGKISQNTIRLNAFDTYYQYRQIPVPVTTVDNTDPTKPVSTTIIELRQFGFPFESPSITDFWGQDCWNIGRPNVKNPYENELIHLNQIALSGPLNPNAQLNYLDYFSDANKVEFKLNNTGGIVYVSVKTGMVLVVCQYKNFIVGFNDNIARLNENNILSVPSREDSFGLPERATTGDYGCQFFDKNTIREKEGLVEWLDRNRVAILQNDFQRTVDVSRYNMASTMQMRMEEPTFQSRNNRAESTIASWLTKKIKYQQQYNIQNPNSVRYFHGVINPSNFEYIFSEFTIGGNSYVNQERDIDIASQETISFDILVKVWKTFLSFTPEYGGYIEGANSGQLLFSFKNAIPYSHSVIGNTSWNVFFGVPCESVYRFIINTDGFKKKKFQNIAVYCTQKLFWSDQVITENNQVSRILKAWWTKALYFYFAPFLCDINKKIPNNILESDNLEGSWADVRLIGDPDGTYSEIYGVTDGDVAQETTG